MTKSLAPILFETFNPATDAVVFIGTQRRCSNAANKLQHIEKRYVRRMVPMNCYDLFEIPGDVLRSQASGFFQPVGYNHLVHVYEYR